MRFAPPIRLLALAALVLSGASCTPKPSDDHVDCKAPGGCSGILSTLATRESLVTLIPDGAGGVYAALYGSGENPSCSAGVVCHGALWRISSSGDVIWKVGEKKSVDRPFLIPGGVAYRTGDGRVEAIRADGQRLWRWDAADPTLSAASALGDVIVVGGGQASRVNGLTGAAVWTVPFAVTLPATPGRLSGHAVLVIGFSGATALSRSLDAASGATMWEATLPADLSAPTHVIPRTRIGWPLLVSDRLSQRDDRGTELWGYDGTEGFRFVLPSEDGGFVGVGPVLDSITRFRENGTVLWSGPMPGAVVWLVTTLDGQILIGQQDGLIRKIKEDTGLTLWSYGGVDTVKAQAPPVFTRSTGNAVFGGGNVGQDSDTHLTTVSPAGQGLERWDAGARVVSVALGEEERVFFATADGHLYVRLPASF